MALFYGDIVKFINKIVEKSEVWPRTDEEWEALSCEQENEIRNELNNMLCVLGQHDYGVVWNFEQVDKNVFNYTMTCFNCEAKKGVSLHTDEKTVREMREEHEALKAMR